MNISYQIVGWIARLLTIGAIVFVSIFALDAFSEGSTLIDQIKDFVIHLFPSFVLLVFLIISWKRPLIGGLLFLFVGLLLTPWVYKNNFQMNESVMTSIGIVSTITLPFIITGILFIWSSRLKANYLKKEEEI